MSPRHSNFYAGQVVHKRLRPRRHGFRYRVFCLCLDVEEIDALDAELRFFSRNRRNVLSFYDRDFGKGDGISVAAAARALLDSAGLSEAGCRIKLLCYPRLFGFVFNPLSVYFCYDNEDRLGALIYEVSNTFRERRSYVIGVTNNDRVPVTQACAKEMYVSPFTAAEGSYAFHIVKPKDEVVVGVALRDTAGPSLKTHFRGQRVAMSDGSIVRLIARHPLMTFKVIAAIHFEALRLLLKRIPATAHQSCPAYAVSVVRSGNRNAMDVQ